MRKITAFLGSFIIMISLFSGSVCFAEVTEAAVPSYYNSADNGWISGVDAQLNSSACWTFTQNELIEINVAKKTGQKYDFSEQAMKFETSFLTGDNITYTRYPNDGGNEYMSTAYLASYGSVLDKDAPFSMEEIPEYNFASLKKYGYLDHAKMFKYGVNSGLVYPAKAVDKIKELVMEYGAVGTGVYYDKLYENANATNYYYTGNVNNPDHAIAIIGWDDNYSASNFKNKPAGDGAFIVKNSWGKYHNNATSDIVYVSYYDKIITFEFFVSDYEINNDLYDNIYQHDWYGWTQNGYMQSNSVLCISRFTADSLTEKITAVSTYAVQPNTKAEVYINTFDGDPYNQAAFKKVYEGTFDSIGYYTMSFEPQTLNCQTYAVAIRTSYGSSFTEFAMQGNSAGIVAGAKNIPNTCYVGTEFGNVMPLEKAFANADQMLCIKAFTTDGEKPPKVDSVKKFNDIKNGQWFVEAVDYVVGAGIFNGVSETEFEPQTPMNRAMFVRVLSNLCGVDPNTAVKNMPFNDVKSGAWYAYSVKWAHERGIVNGTTNTTFSPETPITREQMCAMLIRFVDYMGITLKDTVPQTQFADDGLIQDYAKESVYRCQKSGIINGMGNNMFSPRESATRAHIASMMMKFCENYVY